MQQVIEKLLILQDRDRRILQLKDQLARVGPERQMLQTKSSGAQAALEAAKQRAKHIETERKKLELEVEAKKQLIGKYSLQQFQTKKNDEYKALAHEIETCNKAIVEIEDQELELMEQAEATAREVAAATREAGEAKKLTDGQLQDLAEREQNLNKELEELEGNREQLTSEINAGILARYDRLLRGKGGNVVVGIEHGVCGGCHMKFPTQLIVTCRAAKELVCCPNCGRILYYTPHMDMVVAE